MKTPRSLASIVMLLTAAAPALPVFRAAAEERGAGPYLTVEAGPNWMMNTTGTQGGGHGTVEFDPGIRLGVGLGYNLNRYASLEISTGITGNSVKDTDYSLAEVPLLVGGVLRYPNQSRFEPYVGAGVGFVSSVFGFDTDCCNSYDTDMALAWQGQAGLRYRLGSTCWLGLGYQYLGVADTEYSIFGVRTELDTLHSHSALIHFQMRF
jgi:opacity protein-like surface antigen